MHDNTSDAPAPARPPADDTPPGAVERRMALAAAALAAIGPLSLALVGPSLPVIATYFAVGEDAVAPAMTLYLAGFAGGQLINGPLSDRYGRRPVTLGFLALYLIATAVALTASGPWMLTAGRMAQGLGASVGMTMARAMVRDRFQGQAAARILSRVGMVVSVAPALAPVIGGAITGLMSWRGLFGLMAVYCVGLAVFAFRLRETVAVDPAAGRLNVRHVLSTYATVLSDKAFLAPTLTSACGIGGVYTFVSIAPFILGHGVGLTAATIGPVMALPAVGYFTGALFTNRLLKRIDAGRLVLWGVACLAVAGLSYLALMTLLPPAAPTVVAPAVLWGFGMSLVMPGTSSASLAPFPRAAGAAAALMGCLQMITGTIGGFVATTLTPDVVTGLAVVPLALAAICVICQVVDQRRGRTATS